MRIDSDMQKYLARSQQVKAKIAGDQSICDKVRMIRTLRRGEPFGGVSWHGTLHSVYALGQLTNGLWVVARVPNHRIYEKIGDLEYCSQKTAEAYYEHPEDVVAEFCVGVVPPGTKYPYQKRTDALLLTEDLTQGGQTHIRNIPDTKYGIIYETRQKAWYDFDVCFNTDIYIEKRENPLFFNPKNRLEV